MTVKKNAYGLTLAFALLFSAATGLILLDSEKANASPAGALPQVPIISINSDGSITPETDLISRNGNTYTLTADINEYEISIGCSNIMFDGAGHTLRAKSSDHGVYLSFLTNVTVKNIEITGFYNAISMHCCSHCRITGVKTSWYIELASSDYNTVTESTAKICLMSDVSESTQSNNNGFFRNNITEIVFSGVKSSVESNIFYKNNMLLGIDDL